MFFDINNNLCERFAGIDPIKLLDYPAEDVFDLINNVIRYNSRNKKTNNSSVVRRQASDNWF